MFSSLSRAVPAFPLILLASCVGAPERPPAPRPVASSAPAAAIPAAASPVLTQSAPVEWQYRPATAGDWTYRAGGGGSAATFASAGAGPLLTLRCDRAGGRVVLTRAGAAQSSMTVRTSYGAISWPAAATGAGTAATRAVNDAALDQIAYSRGRFSVEVAGSAALIVPAWAEVGRVIEDCRS